MSDVYNSKFAKLVRCLNRYNGEYAITTSATCTRYTCSIERVGDRWRRHEEKHKDQYLEHGWFKFVMLYIWDSIRYGYHDNPFEIDARSAE